MEVVEVLLVYEFINFGHKNRNKVRSCIGVLVGADKKTKRSRSGKVSVRYLECLEGAE
jgi:hypothetical protein